MKRKRGEDSNDSNNNNANSDNLIVDQDNAKRPKIEDQEMNYDLVQKHNAATGNFLENLKNHTVGIDYKVPVMFVKGDKIKVEHINQNLEKYLQKNKQIGIEIGEISLLHYAIHKGDIGWVKHLLEKGANVNELALKNSYIYFFNQEYVISETGSKGFLPLATAVENNNKEMVQLLVNNGANINDGKNLTIAVNNENISMVQYLLDIAKSTNIKIVDIDDNMPLISACVNGGTYIAKILIEHGADIELYNDYTEIWPLQAAVANNCLDIVNILLGKGANTESISKYEEVEIPLHIIEILEIASYLDKLLYREVDESNGDIWERSEGNLIGLADKMNASIYKYIGLCEEADIKLDKIDLDPYLMLQNRFDNNLAKLVKKAVAEKGIKSVQSLLQEICTNIEEANLLESKTVESIKTFISDFKESEIMSLKSITAINVVKYMEQGAIDKGEITELPEEIQSFVTNIERLMPTTVMDVNNIGDINTHNNDSDIA